MELEVRTLHAVMFEDLKLTRCKVAEISESSLLQCQELFLHSYVARYSFLIKNGGLQVAFACLCYLSILPESMQIQNPSQTIIWSNSNSKGETQGGDC